MTNITKISYNNICIGRLIIYQPSQPKTQEIQLEICTGFAAVLNETATATLWPLVMATVAVRTTVGHFLNGHNTVGAIVCTVFYAVFPYYTSRSAIESAVSALH